MSFKQKADLVAWAHLLLIISGIISLPLLFIISWWYVFVLALSVFSIASWIIFRGRCFITDIEKGFRRKHGSGVFEEGFIQFYLQKIFSIQSSPKTISTILYSYSFLLLCLALKQFLFT